MTKLLEKAFETVRRLPSPDRDEIALRLAHVDAGYPEPVDPAHLFDVIEGPAQARNRQFAADPEVEAAFRRFDR